MKSHLTVDLACLHAVTWLACCIESTVEMSIEWECLCVNEYLVV